MDKETEQRKSGLLKQMEDFFQSDEGVEEASIFTAEELGTPMDMLRIFVTDYGPGLIDILGEFSFIPFEGPQEVWYFSSVLTIMTGIPKDGVSSLAGAISRLNFYMPYGCFAISPDGDMLVYKAVTAVRADHDDKVIYEDIELSADKALTFAENYTDLLIKVADGGMPLKDFIDTLPEG